MANTKTARTLGCECYLGISPTFCSSSIFHIYLLSVSVFRLSRSRSRFHSSAARCRAPGIRTCTGEIWATDRRYWVYFVGPRFFVGSWCFKLHRQIRRFSYVRVATSAYCAARSNRSAARYGAPSVEVAVPTCSYSDMEPSETPSGQRITWAKECKL